MAKKISSEPVKRLDGHAKVYMYLNEHNQLEECRLHILEFRDFERLIVQRPYWEAPGLVMRLPGICSMGHHLAAAKATDVIVGAGTGTSLTATAEKMRRLMHYSQILQSHVLHYFQLGEPDDFFPSYGNKIKQGVKLTAQKQDLAIHGLMMRKLGLEIIRTIAGKKIHGTGAIPGGIHQSLSEQERTDFLSADGRFTLEEMLDWALEAIEIFTHYRKFNKAFIDGFSHFPSNHLSLIRKDGAMDLYHGVLRAKDSEGNKLFEDIDYQEYDQIIAEEKLPWTSTNIPYFINMGKDKGWYRVGPLARLNTADFIPTQKAQIEFEKFKAITKGKPNNHCLHTHYARLIETLHAAEVILELLKDPAIVGDDLVVVGTRQKEGVGCVEAARGTLIHHYKISELDRIEMAELIVPSAHNSMAMHKAVQLVAAEILNQDPSLTEELMKKVEAAILIYDPCFSCVTHTQNNMPLEFFLFDSKGVLKEKKLFN